MEMVRDTSRGLPGCPMRLGADCSVADPHLALGILTYRQIEIVVIVFVVLLAADGGGPGIEAPFQCVAVLDPECGVDAQRVGEVGRRDRKIAGETTGSSCTALRLVGP